MIWASVAAFMCMWTVSVAHAAEPPAREPLGIEQVYRETVTHEQEAYALKARELRLEAIARLEALLAAELERRKPK